MNPWSRVAAPVRCPWGMCLSELHGSLPTAAGRVTWFVPSSTLASTSLPPGRARLGFPIGGRTDVKPQHRPTFPLAQGPRRSQMSEGI